MSISKYFSLLLLAGFILNAPNALALDVDWDKVKNKVVPRKDQATVEAEYLKRVEKDRIREEYGRKTINRNPSGYMTVEEYEVLSAPKDKAIIDYGMPQVNTPYDMQYVPHPIYSLKKYNDPPGTPELSISMDLYKTHQLNLSGITSPNFYFMVYPAVYYYPERGAVTCDLFLVALRDNDSSVNKILKANIANRFPEPILSTDKELNNSAIFRTLTPIDFSADSTKLLVKEKVGSSQDGIWETNAIIYDFSTRKSYKLIELRQAIIYYWRAYHGLDLNDKRWDIYPLGFSKGNQNRIMVSAYAYTGEKPVFLGIWSIGLTGNQPRLISLTNGNVQVSSNGFTIVKDGVVPRTLAEQQEKFERNFVKKQAKEQLKQDKNEVKSLKKEMKEKLKEVDKQFKIEKENYKLMDKLNGTTELNENVEIYNELQENLDEKRKLQAEKEEEKLQLREQKKQEKEQKQQLKQQEKRAKEAAKAQEKENQPPKDGQPLQ